MTKALILLSGGLDSATGLWWAKKKKWKVATLSFSFPGRRKMELRAAKRLANLANVKENYEIFLPFVSAPRTSQSCYIPKRNFIYYAIASSLAEKSGANFVVGAHHSLDGKVFPDATEKYLNQLNQLSRVSKNSKSLVKLIFPFLHFKKEKILRLAKSLQVPFEYTWSCSRNGKKHCWKCNSCKERRDGFRKAGVNDPLWVS